MTSTRLRVFSMAAVLTVAGAALGDNGSDQTLQEVAGYREWSRLTPKPIVVEVSKATYTIAAGDIVA